MKLILSSHKCGGNHDTPFFAIKICICLCMNDCLRMNNSLCMNNLIRLAIKLNQIAMYAKQIKTVKQHFCMFTHAETSDDPPGEKH